MLFFVSQAPSSEHAPVALVEISKKINGVVSVFFRRSRLLLQHAHRALGSASLGLRGVPLLQGAFQALHLTAVLIGWWPSLLGVKGFFDSMTRWPLKALNLGVRMGTPNGRSGVPSNSRPAYLRL